MKDCILVSRIGQRRTRRVNDVAFSSRQLCGTMGKAEQASQGINVGATFGRDNPCNY
jgi:hypothetical protein